MDGGEVQLRVDCREGEMELRSLSGVDATAKTTPRFISSPPTDISLGCTTLDAVEGVLVSCARYRGLLVRGCYVE